MKNTLRTLTLCFVAFSHSCAPPLLAAPPTTGQFLFQQKNASGPFTQFGVTPVTNQAFGWDGSNVVMMGAGGGIAWGSITGTLSNQTDLQTALNLKLSLAGVLPLAGFSSITGALPDANLSANVQLENGVLALGGFSSITGTLADARLSANVQLANGTLALNGFGSVTGTLAAARIADLSATYLTVAAAASGYQPLDGDLTAIAALSGTNNIYYRSAANTWSNVTIGTGLSFSGGSLAATTTGTVSSVAMSVPPVFSLTGSPITTSGTLALSLATQTANTIWAGPTSGIAATPTFRALVAADIPNISASYLTPAAAAAAYQPLDGDLTALAGLSGTNNIYYRSGTSAWSTVAVGTGLTFSGGTLSATGSGGSGSVTSVAMTVPSILGVTGSPVTTSGTLALSLASQDANRVFAGPTTGAAATPTFRALVAADIPSLSSVYQPLDADLTAIAALSGTNTIYYRSAANTWSNVSVGTGLNFTAGSLTSTVVGLDSDVTFTADRFWDVGAFTLTLNSADPVATPYVFSVNTNTNVVDLFIVNGPGGNALRIGADSSLYVEGNASTLGIVLRGATGSVGLASSPGNAGTITIGSATNTFSFTNGTASITVPAGVSGTLNPIAFVVPGTGVNTFLATPSGANLATALTTALPASKGGTGLTSLGTGIATALGVNTGSAGAPVLFNGALGTPSSGTVSGNFVIGGTFGAVNGSALTTLNASNISSGSLADARLSANVQLANGTLALGGFGSVTGTLAAARIADLSATYLTNANAVLGYQPLDADLTSLASAGLTNTIYYRSGAGAWSAVTVGSGLTFAAGSLTAAVTGATGSTDNVILRADGTGARTIQGGGVLTLADTGALGFPDGVRQTFNPDGTNGGLNVGAFAGDPASPSNGDLWYDSTANELTARINTVTVALAGLGANTFTGAQTFTGGVVGTTAVGNATAGHLGEYVSGMIDAGSAVSLTTATAANVTSISLTAGDWDVEGSMNFIGAAATTTERQGGISITSTTLPADGSEVHNGALTTVANSTDGVTLPRKRVNVSATTTVYLVGSATFSAGTVTVYGTINARRVR